MLLAGFVNPLFYVFDYEKMNNEVYEPKYTLPYSDKEQLDASQLATMIENSEALEFGHTLESQIDGQLKAGFVLSALYEDTFPGMALSKYLPLMMATRAVKLP